MSALEQARAEEARTADAAAGELARPRVEPGTEAGYVVARLSPSSERIMHLTSADLLDEVAAFAEYTAWSRKGGRVAICRVEVVRVSR